MNAGANDVQITLNETGEGQAESTHLEYDYYGTHVTIDLTVSSNKWEAGKEITAIAKCTTSPEYGGAPWGFNFTLVDCEGEFVAYDPSFAKIGSNIDQISWSGSASPSGKFGSTATFTLTFRMGDYKGKFSYIKANCGLSNEESQRAKIYFK